MVHIHPENMLLRNVLANFLLSNYKKSQKYSIAASRIAQSTISLQLTSGQRFVKENFSCCEPNFHFEIIPLQQQLVDACS